MNENQSSLDSLIGTLKQQRDDLKLQMHLASMEAKEEYDRISEKVDALNEHYEPLKGAVSETTGNVVSALGLVADELKVGYERIRKTLSEQK